MLNTRGAVEHKILRYVLFTCAEYKGSCGWEDYDADSDSVEELKKYKLNEKWVEWWNIVDLKTGKTLSKSHESEWE